MISQGWRAGWVVSALLFIAALLGLFMAQQVSYLLFHSLVEIYSVIIGASIFILIWNARHLVRSSAIHMLGIVFLVTSLIDLAHTLAFRGMGVIPGTGLDDPHAANLATQLWLAARYSQAIGLLVVLWLARRFPLRQAAPGAAPAPQMRAEVLLLAGAVWTALLLLSIFSWRIFPDAYLTELTPFKIISEYIIIALLLIAVLIQYRYRAMFDRDVWLPLIVAVLLLILSEMAFTEYLRVEDWMNFTGHVLKVLAYALIYRAIIQTSFVKPQETLFQERMASELALRESEQRARERAAQLSAIMDTVPAIVWITNDPKAEQVTGNLAAAQMLRMAADDNLSKTGPDQSATRHFRVLQNGRELAPEELPLQISAATGQPVRNFEETVLFDDGAALHLLGNVSPLLDEENRPIGAVAAFIDITKRVNALRALQESEQRYRSLFETISESFTLLELVFDAPGQLVDFCFLEANPAFERMTGLRRDEVTGRRFSELTSEPNPWLAPLRRLVETNEAQRQEYFEPLVDKYLDVLFFRTDEKRVAALVVDITEQQRSQLALQKSESQLRRLVESNIIGIIFYDENGQVILANDAFLEITGYSRADLQAGAVSWQKLTPPEYMALDAEHAAEALQRGGATPYEKAYLRKDGSTVPILIGFALVPEGETRFICFVVDLTEQKQAQQEARRYADRLEASNRELEYFAFVASHDMQEPLRKIQAFGERLKVTLAQTTDPTVLDYLERMLSASRRMRGMIDDLLSLSRVTTRAQPFMKVDLNRVLEDVLSDLELRIESTRAQVAVDDLPTIDADPTQMHQLLLNLLSNALKFHAPERPPAVQIRCDPPSADDMLTLRVIDQGIGFEQKFADRIFQPFQRLHGRTEFEGSGIGLSVCKKIVDRHGGTIAVQSDLDHGSVFTIQLPVHQPHRSETVHAKNE